MSSLSATKVLRTESIYSRVGVCVPMNRVR